MELNRLWAWLKDLFFPNHCVDCQAEGIWLCALCLDKICSLKEFSSQSDKAVTYVDRVIALFAYGDNTISQLIQLFKYKYIAELSEDFRKIILASSFVLSEPGFTIIPVPLHERRERERGFNQSEILAKLFAEKLGLEINKNLHRSVYTKQQAKLSGEARRNNLKDVFAFNNAGKSVPEKVLLVDDVFTTGATMDQCAKVLKASGVKIVWGLALARG